MEFPLAETESRNSTRSRPALRPEAYTCHLHVMTSTKARRSPGKQILMGGGGFFEGRIKQHQSLKVRDFFSQELVNKDSDIPMGSMQTS